MSVLVVTAHPDDEVLGAGGTLWRLSRQGLAPRACFLVAGAAARKGRPALEELHSDMRRAGDMVGLGEPILGDFPNIRLNTVAHLDLVQFIEGAIAESRATTVLTHHPADLNEDHRQVSRACQAAARLFQRRDDVPPLRALYYMEILSSTEWSFPGVDAPFTPDTFFEIGEEGVARKLESLACYRGVMRPYPHPRSEEAVRSLATLRGAQSGRRYAEAFQCAFRMLESGDFGVESS